MLCSCDVSRDSSMKNFATTIPRIPTGTLTKKIQFQLMLSTMRPPASGPIASAMAETPAQMPIAWPRCSDSLHRTRADQEAGVRREAAGERREREDREADDEDAAAAEEIAELAARDQQGREDERVRGDDPLELRDRDVEVSLDRRQRDVHHRVVEHDHEEAERNRDQRPPFAVLVGEEACLHPLVPSLG